ncbi:hypothetical protein F2P56_017440 [Juglans regia]|uniref:RRM domain-containing protein n=1 Tax=Juglans regia TaxID=51240 RepID=A0A833U448_JUGRE|nr:hypothetical protein F2P56_017440 [Juglans regia]
MADVMLMKEIETTADRLGIDLSTVDLDSISLPPGQDFGILSDDEDVLQGGDNPELDIGFGNIIIVDNLPVVPREKFDKLEGVIRKIYSQIGVIKEDGLWMPIDPETQKTLGYCFIEFNSPLEAELAREKTNGYKLDRSHIFAVNMFDEFDTFMKVPDKWAPPEFTPYTSGENLQHWLTDEKARDQFVIRAGSDTEVLWNDARHLKPEPVYKRAFWTESFVQWSPLGTYLLTTLKGKQANALFWSPTGRFVILAGLKGFNGQLEFYNVDELETMATAEHFMATDIEWDPTGRYVATAVTSVHEMENGFNIWSFNGKLLYRILKDHFFQFLWRPRPPSFLSPEKEEEIAKNLKKYSKKYEAEDQDVSMLLSEQDREKRRMLKEEWDKWLNEWKRLHEEEKLERQTLRDGEVSDEEEEYEAKEVEVEEILDVSEEVLSFEE